MAINFLLKRSNTASKRPTAAQLDIGELSLNYESTTPGVFFEDSAGNVRKVGPCEVSGSAPNSSPAGSSGNSTGELWLDTGSNNALKIYDGSAFVVPPAVCPTQDAAPSGPVDGALWYDSDQGRLFVYYDDGSTQQWVDASPTNATSSLKQLDDISGSFNGTTTAFTLQIGGANFSPVSDIQLLIAIGGVVQTPGTAYTVSGSTITFTSAPPGGATFSGVVLASSGFFAASGSNKQVQFNNNGDLGGTSFLTIETSTVGVGASIIPDTDNTYDLGSSSFRFANVYTGDLHLKNDRGDWTIIEEEDALTIRNNKTGKVYDIVMKERGN